MSTPVMRRALVLSRSSASHSRAAAGRRPWLGRARLFSRQDRGSRRSWARPGTPEARRSRVHDRRAAPAEGALDRLRSPGAPARVVDPAFDVGTVITQWSAGEQDRDDGALIRWNSRSYRSGIRAACACPRPSSTSTPSGTPWSAPGPGREHVLGDVRLDALEVVAHRQHLAAFRADRQQALRVVAMAAGRALDVADEAHR